MAGIVVVGAAGFIGGALVSRLAAAGTPVIAVTRRPTTAFPGAAAAATGDLTANTDWHTILADARAVVHLASRAHAPAGEAECHHWIEREVAAARHLAIAAGKAGVRQVLLVSTVKVHGEATTGRPFRASDPLAPVDAYAIAKAGIEAAMTDALAHGSTALAILRPPLVYGPEVKANFLALLRLVRRAPLLPLGGIANRRSFVYRENLVDLMARMLLSTEPIRGAYLVRDDEELSTTDLVRRIGRELGRVPVLLTCPVSLLRVAGQLLRRQAAVASLVDSLQVDDAPTRVAVAWVPPASVDAGLQATCRWFLQSNKDGPGTVD